MKNSGYTLLETIIALAVILGAIAGPYSLATRGILSSLASKNKLAAYNLSQEGIELVRKIRDDNVLAGSSWDSGISSGSWKIDVVNNALSPFDSAALLYDGTLGLYQNNTGSASLFTRRITIQKPPANPTPGIPSTDQILVISTVTWTERGLSKTAELQEIMYNWQ